MPFAALSCVNIFRVAKRMNDGILEMPAQKPDSPARRGHEMINSILMVVNDLRRQSPYAMHAVLYEREWHMPFHPKICVWRLIKRMHKERKPHVPEYLSKAPVH